jgi:hypothetical protein
MWFGPLERNTLRPRENEVVLLKAALPEPAFSSDPPEEVSTRSFYSSRPGNCNETRGPIDGPEVVETLYNI